MKIAWFCIPAHGHTNPTLSVVKELIDHGHEVFYFSFEKFRKEIEKAGAVFIRCDDNEAVMEDQGNSDRVGKDPVYAVTLVVSSTLAMDDWISLKLKELQPDLIVSDSVAYWGKLAALKHGIPYVSSTTTFAFNRYSSRYMGGSLCDLAKMLFQMPKMNAQMHRLREKGYPVKGVLDILQNDNQTDTIVYTSAYFQPCAETFSDRYRFIGPSIRPITEPYPKTAEKTIFVSLGTVNVNQSLMKACMHALADTGWQVIVSLGEKAEQYDDIPDNTEVHDYVDQMAVLSIADAFITHCGMNSVSEALYFSVPLVMVPQTKEQSAVARRVRELGAGIQLSEETEPAILEAVRRVLSDPSFKNAAEKISDSFHACGGATEARAFLEEIGSSLS